MFKLDLNQPKDVNFNTHEWMALEKWMEEQLSETYKRLTGLNTDERELRQLQGRAHVLTQMLGFRTQTAAFRPQIKGD